MEKSENNLATAKVQRPEEQQKRREEFLKIKLIVVEALKQTIEDLKAKLGPESNWFRKFLQHMALQNIKEKKSDLDGKWETEEVRDTTEH
jgi:hypothetical protein